MRLSVAEAVGLTALNYVTLTGYDIVVADEAARRRGTATRVGRALSRHAERYVPQALSIFTFVAGLALLLSGATPAQQGRLLWIGELLPLEVIEASHFLASVAGAGLLVVSLPPHLREESVLRKLNVN